MFRILGYKRAEPRRDSRERGDRSMIVLAREDVTATIPPVYIHSACEICEIFQASHCESRSQLDAALRIVERFGSGLLFYSHDDAGFGADALRHLKSGVPRRAWEQCAMDAAEILQSMGIRRISLIGDEATRTAYLQQLGLEVAVSIPILSRGGDRYGTADDV
jgi:GTP cyclohydrolase II